MKPAGKIPMWTGGAINRPGVTPPVPLRVFLYVMLLTAFATFLYGVFGVMGHLEYAFQSNTQMILRAALFFVVPFVIAYAITTNHPQSRAGIVAWFACVGWVSANGFEGVARIAERPWFGALLLAFSAATLWLFVSPRARVYYALIRNQPVPDDLAPLIDELTAASATERAVRRLWHLLEPFAPLFLIASAILIVIAGFMNLSP